MRWKPHVRFGGRAEETDLPRDRHRASARSHVTGRVSRRGPDRPRKIPLPRVAGRSTAATMAPAVVKGSTVKLSGTMNEPRSPARSTERTCLAAKPRRLSRCGMPPVWTHPRRGVWTERGTGEPGVSKPNQGTYVVVPGLNSQARYQRNSRRRSQTDPLTRFCR